MKKIKDYVYDQYCIFGVFHVQFQVFLKFNPRRSLSWGLLLDHQRETNLLGIDQIGFLYFIPTPEHFIPIPIHFIIIPVRPNINFFYNLTSSLLARDF